MVYLKSIINLLRKKVFSFSLQVAQNFSTDAKGQKNSKRFFQVDISSKKGTNEFYFRGLSQITFALRVGRWSEKRVVYYIKSAN